MSPAAAPAMSTSPYLNGSYAMYASSTTPVGSSSGGGNSGGAPNHNAPSPYALGSVSSVGSSVSPSPKEAMSPNSNHGGGSNGGGGGGGSVNSNNSSSSNNNHHSNNTQVSRSNRTSHNNNNSNIHSPASSSASSHSQHMMSPPPQHYMGAAPPAHHHPKGYPPSHGSDSSGNVGGSGPHGMYPTGHAGGDLRQMISMYLPPHHAALEGHPHVVNNNTIHSHHLFGNPPNPDMISTS